ncbi:YkvI family membrane protein [Tissierella creatinophila]|uniref:Membrane protein YkvI n=1 Tax=Tissierella creatinophila DSM 6911 TaxID=1123403 RepID=A0A1U7M8Q9_TISCR|nr:hypothetical protein [Tissierella creatinophila]OLS03630.1 hypothetical protein TICRE_03260 [Tissierella creatinophila DSM 6911]
MLKGKIDLKMVFSYAGAFIAFLIGSGFATGQEVLQYFSSYGFKGLLGVLTVSLLFFYVGSSFMSVGQEHKFENGNEIYKYYCGNKIGTFFDYYSIVFIYMSFIVMIAGAGSAINQQYGLPIPIGGIALGVIAGATVIFGLSNIVDVISKIGPVIILLTITLGIFAIARNPEGLRNANTILSQVEVLKASTNWFFAALSYVGFCMIWLAGFLASMGSTSKSKRESVLGILFGTLGFGLALAIIVLGILANIKELAGSQVPSLALAQMIHPILAIIFSAIVIAGIYTTSVPLLWQVIARFAEEKTKKFKTLTISLTVIGTTIGVLIPFDKLVNKVYVINGYIGIILIGFMIFKSIRNKSLF